MNYNYNYNYNYNLILHIKWKKLKICKIMIKLLQRINWLQCKICREWIFDFENSQVQHSHYEIEIINALHFAIV